MAGDDGYTAVDGFFGPVFVAWNERGASFVSLTDDESVFVDRFVTRFHRRLRGDRRPPAPLVRALETGRVPASLPLDLADLPPFPRAVLDATRRIPRGEVRSYAWVAREAGNAGAVRAAGTALSRNPVSVLVPCHRVVRSDGTVGMYGRGPAFKAEMLRAEGVDLGDLHRFCRLG